MTDAASLSINVDSTSVRKADKDLDDFTQSAVSADKAAEGFADEIKGGAVQVKKFGKAANDAGDDFNSMGSKAGRAGIQIQQLVGQIQGGTNPMLALSQQAADLGIVLGAAGVGVVVSFAAAVGMVLIPQLMGAAKAAEEVAEEIRDLNDEFDTLTEAQRALLLQQQNEAMEEQRGTLKDLNKELKESEGRLAGYRAQLERVGGAEAALNKTRRGGAARTLVSQIKAEEKSLVSLRAQIDTANQALGLQNDEVDKLNGNYVDNAALAEEVAKANAKINATFAATEEMLRRRLALTSDLTEQEKILFEIREGRLQGVSAEQEGKLVALAQELDLQKQLAEEMKQLDKDRADADKAAVEALKEKEAANKKIAKTLEDEIAGALTGGANQSFSEILAGFGDMLLAMAAQAVAADIVGGLFGAKGVPGGQGTDNTAGLLSTISGFAGFFDQGGNIPSGQFGIAGENGPEIIQGPANVTSTKDTAAAMGGANIGNINMSFPGVGNANEARIAAGQAAREINRITSSAQRFA